MRDKRGPAFVRLWKSLGEGVRERAGREWGTHSHRGDGLRESEQRRGRGGRDAPRGQAFFLLAACCCGTVKRL